MTTANITAMIEATDAANQAAIVQEAWVAAISLALTKIEDHEATLSELSVWLHCEGILDTLPKVANYATKIIDAVKADIRVYGQDSEFYYFNGIISLK